MTASASALRLSLVVVSYEMSRELPRTLHSLSPGYQRPAPAWEVIVVDNGSRTPPRLEDFAGLGLDLSIHCLPPGDPSPVAAINFGLSLARAPCIGVWIDGARLASPGLLDACLRATELHPRAVVATRNFHLGRQLQYVGLDQGYGPDAEDRLLASIRWPEDGYRLFDIATPEMQSGPGEPLLESNAIFLARGLWDELGGYDPRFRSPGGGGANPDLLVRACALPGTQLIRVLEEGTFHQVHGGVTTRAAHHAAMALKEVSREYYRLRGRPLVAVRQAGWLFRPSTGEVEKALPVDRAKKAPDSGMLSA